MNQRELIVFDYSPPRQELSEPQLFLPTRFSRRTFCRTVGAAGCCYAVGHSLEGPLELRANPVTAAGYLVGRTLIRTAGDWLAWVLTKSLGIVWNEIRDDVYDWGDRTWHLATKTKNVFFNLPQKLLSDTPTPMAGYPNRLYLPRTLDGKYKDHVNPEVYVPPLAKKNAKIDFTRQELDSREFNVKENKFLVASEKDQEIILFTPGTERQSVEKDLIGSEKEKAEDAVRAFLKGRKKTRVNPRTGERTETDEEVDPDEWRPVQRRSITRYGDDPSKMFEIESRRDKALSTYLIIPN